MTTIRRDARALTDEEIRAFEERLGWPLPEEYRRFLLENNGGRPTPDVIDINGLPGGSTDVQVFFGLDRSVKSSGLDWNLEMLRGRIDERLLPIACDSGGSVFCLSLHGIDLGCIIYCDFVESKVSYYRVAPSFSAFLEKLRPFE